MAMTEYWDQITTGTTVYDLNGEKLGKVRDIDPGGQYLMVEKGWLFVKDFYIPADSVSQVTEDGIQINLLKDQLSDARYDSPPVPTTASGAPGGANYSTSPMSEPSALADTAQSRPATGASADQGDVRMPVYEEELVAGKRQQEQGQVHLHKDVVEEQQTVDVPLQRERVRVERVPYSGDATAAGDTFAERDIDVPVMGEEAVAAKRVRGVEEVHVRKDVVTDNQSVSDTVRKERVTVDGADVDDEDLTTGTTSGAPGTIKNRMVDDAAQVRDDATTASDRATDRWADR